MYFPSLPGRAPDILFVAKRNLHRIKENHLKGPADLVIEIISEGTRGLDRSDKYYEYEKGGIREYWLIDPLRKQAEFYRLDRGGVYRLVNVGDDGVFRSEVLKGLWMKPEWFWRKPLPTVLHIQREWAAAR